MEVIDESKIGDSISWLGEDHVYLYDENRVIKFSRLDCLRGARDLPYAYLREVEECTKIFGEYYLVPNILVSNSGRRVAMTQPFITGEQLKLQHLNDANIQQQLKDILQRLKQASAPGIYIDLVGGGAGLFTALLGNIFVTPDNKLIIIDIDIVRAPDFVWWIRPIMRTLIPFGNFIQNRRLRRVSV